ncbi:MAG: hypothetical protein MK135_03810 [Polyangiaceae bacterium]|nr:hypothetical protein [Polyangiaceae bacterium]
MSLLSKNEQEACVPMESSPGIPSSSEGKAPSRYTFKSKKSLYLLGLFLFLLSYALVYSNITSLRPYQLKGKWIVVTDYGESVVSPRPMTRLYSRLGGWDGQWYYHIAKNGYHCSDSTRGNNPNICNVTFFPLIPFLGSTISKVFKVPLQYSIQLMNQLSFLLIIFLMLKFASMKSNSISLQGLLSVLVLIFYPGSIYFFSAYAEPLLALFLLLTIFCSVKLSESYSHKYMAGLTLSCFLVTLVKTTGILVTTLPVFYLLLKEKFDYRSIIKKSYFFVAPVAGCLSLASFFLYSHIQFGKWNIYYEAVTKGWSKTGESTLSFDPLNIFRSFTLHDHPAIRLSNVIMIVLLAFIVLYSFYLVREKGEEKAFLIALFLFFLGVFYFHAVLLEGESAIHMNFMRHMCPYIAIVSLLVLQVKLTRNTNILNAFLALLLVVEVYYSSEMTKFFGMGLWVS